MESEGSKHGWKSSIAIKKQFEALKIFELP
jgi:hypothetical protein